MNKYLRVFLHRGLIFGGFGPIILGIVYAIIGASAKDLHLGGKEILIAIISIYMLAFLQAGASVFNQIEGWPLAKSLFFHFGTIYVAYLGCYLINTWIPFVPVAVLIFTGAFIISYVAIWLTVYYVVKLTEKKLNSKISK